MWGIRLLLACIIFNMLFELGEGYKTSPGLHLALEIEKNNEHCLDCLDCYMINCESYDTLIRFGSLVQSLSSIGH